MRRVLGGLALLVAVGAGLLLLGDGGSEDPTSPEAVEHALDDEESLAGPLPAYVPPPPPAEPATHVTETTPLPTLEGKKETFLFVRVVDPDGVPVPRAWVHVEAGRGEDWREHVEETEDGVARIPAPAPDERMNVEVTDPRDAEGKPLNLKDRRIEDLAVDAAEVVVALERARRLSGRVVDEEGSPLAGVRVRAAAPRRFSTARDATTREDGTFELRALPKGPLEVRVPRDDPWLPVPPILVPEDQGEVDVVVCRRRALLVRVLDHGGRPVRGADVRVRWRWADIPRGGDGSTDEEGWCRVEDGCAAARYDVHVDGSGATPVIPDGSRPDHPHGDGTLVMRLPAAAAIRGRVVDPHGNPVPDGRVIFRGTGEENAHVYAYAEVVRGAFVFERLVAGPYDLSVLPFYGYATPEPLRAIAPDDDVRLVVTPCVTLEGKVLNPGKYPVYVEWHARARRWWSIRRSARQDGSFEIPALVPVSGSLYVLGGAGEGLCALLEDVDPKGGPVEVELVPAGHIAGRIEVPGEHPPAFDVYVVRGHVRLRAFTSSDRTFHARVLPPGAWRVEARRKDETLLAAVDGVETGREDVVLRLPPP